MSEHEDKRAIATPEINRTDQGRPMNSIWEQWQWIRRAVALSVAVDTWSHSSRSVATKSLAIRLVEDDLRVHAMEIQARFTGPPSGGAGQREDLL